jgi:hypothetical protein
VTQFPNKPRRAIRLGFWITIGLLVAAGGYHTHERSERGRNCRICAATYDYWKLKAYGTQIWSWDTDPIPTEDTKNYFDKYLAYSHEHEWMGGGYARYSIGMVGCGHSTFGSYPQYQRELTAMGFRLVAASGILDAGDRRTYFESIIQPEDVDHYMRVRSTFALVDEQIPKEPWVKWYPYKVWSPSMEGINIPALVQAGQLLPKATP